MSRGIKLKIGTSYHTPSLKKMGCNFIIGGENEAGNGQYKQGRLDKETLSNSESTLMFLPQTSQT